MRVHFLLTSDLESPAGGGRYFPLASALVRRGHEVQISTLHGDYDSLRERIFERNGVEVHYVGQMPVLKRGDRKTYFSTPRLLQVTAHAAISLYRSAIRYEADILQVGKPQPMNGLAGLYAVRRKGTPLFVDCDDLEAANNRFSSRIQQRLVASVESLVVRKADHVTAHSRTLMEQLIHLGADSERTSYLPHGTDPHRFGAVDPTVLESLREELGLQGRRVVVFVGSMSLASHAVDLLLEAFAHVLKLERKAALLLVGGGEDFDRLRAQAEESGLGEAAIFTGRVPSGKTPCYYQLGTVSVDPVHDNPAGRSSVSLKMFESWAAGTPLITVDVGDRAQLLGEPKAGLIVPPGDPEALARAILRVLYEPNLQERLRLWGLQRAKAYSWDNIAGELEQHYQDALKANS